MVDSQDSQSDRAISDLEIESKLLLDLEKSSKALDETFARLAKIETKVFAIVEQELDEKRIDEETGEEVYVMSAVKASIIFHKLNDSVLKRHKSKLDTIQVLNGVRKNADSEIGDDSVDNVDEDMPDSLRRGAMKCLTQYFKDNNRHRAKTYERKKPK